MTRIAELRKLVLQSLISVALLYFFGYVEHLLRAKQYPWYYEPTIIVIATVLLLSVVITAFSGFTYFSNRRD